MGRHRLDEVHGIPQAVVVALQRRWLVTAEEVLAASASAEGRAGLRRLLSLEEGELEGLLEKLVAAVGPAAADALMRPTPGGPTGVRLSDEEQDRFAGKGEDDEG